MAESVVPLVLTALALTTLPYRRPGRGGRLPAVPMWARYVAGVAAAGLLLDLPWWLLVLLIGGAALIARRVDRRAATPSLELLRQIAAALDLIAACLDAGLPMGAAWAACLDQPGLPPPLVGALRQSRAILAMGGDGEAACRPLARVPRLAPLAAGARRSALGGVRLAEVARELAADLRAECRSTEEASAGRAGIAMTAPLALCFLPAFLCLGLAPVVIGLVTSLDIW